MSKTSKELEGKLAELQAASVEAGVEFKRIDEQIEQAACSSANFPSNSLLVLLIVNLQKLYPNLKES